LLNGRNLIRILSQQVNKYFENLLRHSSTFLLSFQCTQQQEHFHSLLVQLAFLCAVSVQQAGSTIYNSWGQLEHILQARCISRHPTSSAKAVNELKRLTLTGQNHHRTSPHDSKTRDDALFTLDLSLNTEYKNTSLTCSASFPV